MKLLEIVIVLGIFALIFVGVATSFRGLEGSGALVSSTESVLSALATARAQTLAFKDGTRYGVHFASTTVTVFPGTVWSGGLASTTPFALVPGVVVSGVDVAGGGVDVVFDRFTGKTSQYGTATLQVSSTLASSTVIIQRAGVFFSQ